MKDFYGLIIIIMLLGLAAEVYFLAKPRRNSSVGAAPILVDTSVLMDGRVTGASEDRIFTGQNYRTKECIDGIAIISRRRRP